MRPPTSSPADRALELFAPIAGSYERWARVLSMGQDSRWRLAMVGDLGLPARARVLDVAAGTGSITRLLQTQGHDVISLDQSAEMLSVAVLEGATVVVATAERLPFPDGVFDGLTFGYLLRYVDSLPGCLEELARVVRPGGMVGMVEFGRPDGVWRPLWWLYTRIGLAIAGVAVGSGWREVGRFLGPSIENFSRSHPPSALRASWEQAGMGEVRIRRMSLGGGLVMWGRRL